LPLVDDKIVFRSYLMVIGSDFIILVTSRNASDGKAGSMYIRFFEPPGIDEHYAILKFLHAFALMRTINIPHQEGLCNVAVRAITNTHQKPDLNTLTEIMSCYGTTPRYPKAVLEPVHEETDRRIRLRDDIEKDKIARF
jgi:hypothetical protein